MNRNSWARFAEGVASVGVFVPNPYIKAISLVLVLLPTCLSGQKLVMRWRVKHTLGEILLM